MWWLLMQTGLIKPVRRMPPLPGKPGDSWIGLGAIGFVLCLFWFGPWGLVPALLVLGGGFWLAERRRRQVSRG